ncbi:uncharacterized protein EI97DRAFT_431099 [Westerdykella ornata]|uniref:Uncharacterized protein n=1 Tax=Westerdykella ornata TaxID=318751 RepID=A0A6A6JQE6_WESOR|nr:uncharacterized protein EI97DRAFT_431099 [Westerdykella ornata]KAF2278851.1 hypothetical protein EI97DRAFT_431099 [Westerdykella ornata]
MALVFPVTEYEAAIEELQKALEKTCQQLPYLKGKVIDKGLEQRKESYIVWEEGASSPHFQERVAPEGLPSYKQLQFDRTPFPPSLWVTPPVSPEGTPGLGATYTRIEGGLVVCIVTYHKVVDGIGYSHLLRVLADNARGKPSQGPDPDEISHRRARILGGNAEVSEQVRKLDFESLLERHPEYTLRSRRAVGGVVPLGPKIGPQYGTNKVFAISGQKVDAVKAALLGRLPPQALTVNNILTALIWTTITYIRKTRSSNPVVAKTSKMDFPISARRVVGPSLLDPPFMGNAICYGITELPFDDIAFIPTEETIGRLLPIINAIANAGAHINADHVAELVRISDLNPDLSDIMPSWLFDYGPGDMHFISWAQVDIYDLDFGDRLGNPRYMRSAFLEMDGLVCQLPRRRVKEGQGEKEVFEVSFVLKAEDLQRLERSEYWQSWLVQDRLNGTA